MDQLAEATNTALKELDDSVSKMAGMTAANCVSADSRSVTNCLANGTEKLYYDNKRSYDVVKKANGVATAPGAGGEGAELIKADYEAAQPLILTSESLAGARLARYGLFVGPSYSLGGDGSWKSGGEFIARFESAVQDHVPFLCPQQAAWCRTGSEFSYHTVAALDKKNDSGTSSSDPFKESGGIFRYTGALQVHANDWFGAMGIMGLTALKTDAETGLRTRPRFGAGMHFQTLYSDGALGQLFAGYVNDRIWDRPVALDALHPDAGTRIEKNYSRWVIDGLFFIPGIDIGGFRLVTRLTADAPVNRRGPSDVRASILLHYDLNKWLDGVAAPQVKAGK